MTDKGFRESHRPHPPGITCFEVLLGITFFLMIVSGMLALLYGPDGKENRLKVQETKQR
jgi:hypothetical protein